ncbi:MAG TPA: radical SAM protein [Pilimelia sp.]|nr:radical SAM protein [Pilimelia sp.]
MSPTALTQAQGVLTVRLAAGVTLRTEDFGAIAYVGERDDFFALDQAYAGVVRRAAGARGGGVRGAAVQSATVGGVAVRGAAGSGAAMTGADSQRARLLASLGICMTDPATPERPHLGRSLVGDFIGLPTLSRPLVVNCFSTAHCPLSCGYCHADDLMIPFRASEPQTAERPPGERRPGERRASAVAVARTASLVPAMVGVVTGGDPIVVPDRAIWLIERLAARKRIVVDTSGVGDIEPLLPALVRHRAHVRVSLDSADAAVNDRARPVNPRYVPRGTSAFASAHATLRRLREAGVPCSVQTVVGRHNQDLDQLRALCDHLVTAGVRNWVLHVAVPAGKAARHPGLLPDAGALDRLRALVTECVEGGMPIDVRVTGTHRSANAVLLVDTAGRLCVERPDRAGKQVIWRPEEAADPGEVARRYRRHVDLVGHASRYLNGTLEAVPQRVLAA